jgi:AraC-like DNA-binding protein
MSDPFESGVLYTDYPALAAATPFPSLWSYEACARGSRDAVAVAPDGRREYWLHRSDPLLNTLLPGTHVSLVVNFADRWATGRSLPATSLVPSISVVGPFTRPQLLRVGRRVRAVGVVIPALLARDVFGVPPPALVNQIVPLHDLWPRDEVERLLDAMSERPLRDALALAKRALMQRLRPAAQVALAERAAVRLVTARGGRLTIEEMATRSGISRQRLARRFHEATGVPPKLFARIVRFQQLVHSLLSTDVSQWAGVAPEVGFYDQAHMINEFRSFAGAPPTVFFQPHDETIDATRVQVHGRPSDWLRPE